MGPMNHLSDYAKNLKRKESTFFKHTYSLPPTILSRETNISEEKKREIREQVRKEDRQYWIKKIIIAISVLPLLGLFFYYLVA